MSALFLPYLDVSFPNICQSSTRNWIVGTFVYIILSCRSNIVYFYFNTTSWRSFQVVRMKIASVDLFFENKTTNELNIDVDSELVSTL